MASPAMERSDSGMVEVTHQQDQHTEVSRDELAIYPVEESNTELLTLVEIFQASAKACPDGLAIDNGDSRLTYQELAIRIDERVRDLHAAGVQTGDRVGIRMTSGTLDLYIGILAILHAGAAYVPVDMDDPEERASLVFSEAAVCVILGDNGSITQHSPSIGSGQSIPGPQNDCWIIFTSGSTGKPKGVAVTHRSAAAFVYAESRIFLQKAPLGPRDRVLAGLSVSFDASCEEMWLAWRYGACLVPAPRSLVKAGADLGNFLTKQKITVVSTVPTLAALWPTETLQGVRLLILGGEACPPQLSDRLATHVGEVWNTYGPTEATVVACAAQMHVGKPVAIGLPLAGWALAVVGDDEKPVRWGQEGELVIAGVGMARYLDPEKDAVKYAYAPVFDGRAYRSGDLVRAERDGLYFCGRNDEQIKINGRRIELGEIDAAMMQLPGVKGAAAAIRKSEMGNTILVGYVVCEPGVARESNEQARLRTLLPPSLVPMLVTVDDIPVRTSGKVDRKALPWPPPQTAADDLDSDSDEDCTRAWIAEQWRKVLGMPASPGTSFFDLGGTSLGAAQLVSMLRQNCPNMSVADVYEHPTLEAMTDRVDELLGTRQTVRVVKPVPWYTFPVQLLVLIIAMVFNTLRLLATFVLLKKSYEVQIGSDSWAGEHAVSWWITIPCFFLFATFIGRLLVTSILVRIFTARVRPGAYPRGGWTHLRVWAAERIVAMAAIGGIPSTSWASRFAWLLGCEVGRDCHIGIAPVTGLATFGSSCCMEPEVDIAGNWLDGNIFYIGTIEVGEGARIGARSHLMPNTQVQAWANVPAGVTIEGLIKATPGEEPTEDEKDTLKSKGYFTDIRATITLLLLDCLPLLPIAPVYGLSPTIVHHYYNFGELMRALIYFSFPGAVIGAGLYLLWVAAFVRFCSIWIKPGNFSWHSTTAWAAWATETILMEARANLFCCYASLFTPVWLRMLGARVGKNVEISNIVPIPKLLNIEDGSFLADDVLVAAAESGRGRTWLGVSTIGKKAFVGNSGIVDGNVKVPEDSLVGVLSTAPHDMEVGASFLGRPAMSLPRKVDDENHTSAVTFNPPMRLKIARGLWELMRIWPTIINGALATLIGIASWWFWSWAGLGWTVLFTGATGIGSGIFACIITIIAKWILTPRVKAGSTHPLWSSFIWRNEVADTFVQSLAVPAFVANVYGTELVSVWLRCLGAKVGRGAWLESHFFPEADLCSIGKGVSVNRGAVAQTHLFHDRLMRLDRVDLKEGATLGPRAIALPGVTINENTTIGAVSLVMRGENVPANTRWAGNPVRPVLTVKKAESDDGSSISDEKDDKSDDEFTE